jgi:hypothetical protein
LLNTFRTYVPTFNSMISSSLIFLSFVFSRCLQMVQISAAKKYLRFLKTDIFFEIPNFLQFTTISPLPPVGRISPTKSVFRETCLSASLYRFRK